MKTTLLLHSATIPTTQFIKESEDHMQMYAKNPEYAARYFLQTKINWYIKNQTPTLDFIMGEISEFMSRDPNWRFISHNVRETRALDDKISWELDIYYYDPVDS